MVDPVISVVQETSKYEGGRTGGWGKIQLERTNHKFMNFLFFSIKTVLDHPF
jgi:hypothetical protein